MNTIATISLLVVMQSTGTLQGIDMMTDRAAREARLAKSPADSDGMCMPVFASAQNAQR